MANEHITCLTTMMEAVARHWSHTDCDHSDHFCELKIDLFVMVRALLFLEPEGVNGTVVRAAAPTFASEYRRLWLREIDNEVGSTDPTLLPPDVAFARVARKYAKGHRHAERS